MSRLSSWKEIASHLGVTVRTAQKWEEERGLPVHRLPGPRGPVSATVAELDKWRASVPAIQEILTHAKVISEVHGSGDQHQGGGSAEARKKHYWLIASAITIFLMLGIGSLVGWTVYRHDPSRTPVTYRIERNVLIILDAKGRERWRKVFPGEIAADAYSGPVRRIWFGDLFGDGKREILFSFHGTQSVFQEDSELYCFSQDGEELWHFVPGRTVHTATETFDPPFGIRQFAVVRNGNEQVVVVTSFHRRYYPSQVVVISARGKLMGEYWHSGHLTALAIADLDHDGKQELYLGGIDNQWRAATLVVLPLDDVSGASQQSDPRYQLLDMALPHERRMLFPRTCINKALHPYNKVAEIRLRKDDLIVDVSEELITGNPSIEYQITPKGRVISVVPSDSFPVVHKKLEMERALDHPFSKKEIEALWKVRVIENQVASSR
jgi:hypothetical protein